MHSCSIIVSVQCHVDVWFDSTLETQDEAGLLSVKLAYVFRCFEHVSHLLRHPANVIGFRFLPSAHPSSVQCNDFFVACLCFSLHLALPEADDIQTSTGGSTKPSDTGSAIVANLADLTKLGASEA